MKGVDLQVGIKYKPDQEISIELMKLLMEKMEVAVKGEVSVLERRGFNKKGA